MMVAKDANNETDAVKGSQVVTTKNDELLTFLFLTVVLAPCVAVAVVGGYGFFVWMLHLIYGPPVG